ncbi:hypothetical protein DNU06_14775 [Putridiphycobacter roseus]|uniref:Uncharacterized protein n=1 Tax=Putridiphycobacter roseus TaxID=2219161 RepID=A0A2W1NK81_9FLAO|nr:hypothetical protein [Putridiphycobacter roseus]PZE16062.1 hypothetical protein DNU06_14775 [Putridiphycobacter roseus]
MKVLLILSLVLGVFACQKSNQHVFYEVVLETGNLKPDDILLKPLYAKEESQCGALFLNKDTLRVYNNFDTNQVFINLKYKYVKLDSGLYDVYTFEDVYIQKNESYILNSELRKDNAVLAFKNNKVKVLDKAINIVERDSGRISYLKTSKDVNGLEFTEIYTVRKYIINKVIYEKVSYPCD